MKLSVPEATGGDDTDMIQAAIDAIPDGTSGNPNILCFPDDQFYTVQEQILFHNRSNLLISGNNSEFFRPVIIGSFLIGAKLSSLPQWLVRDCDEVRMKNFTISSVGTGTFAVFSENDFSILIQGCRDSVFENVHCHAAGGHSIHVTEYTPTPGVHIPAERIDWLGGSCTLANGSALAVISTAEDITFDGVVIDHATRSVLDLELVNDLYTLTNITFKNCTVSNSGLGFISGGGGGLHDGIYILNNTVDTLKGKYGRPLYSGSAKLGTTMTTSTPSTIELTGTVTNYPTSNFIVEIEHNTVTGGNGEFVLCSSRSGTTVTIDTRAYQGSTAAAHAIGVDVKYKTALGGRSNITFDGNTGTVAEDGVMLAFNSCDHVTVTDNIQPFTISGVPTAYQNCSDVIETGNSWN